MTLKSHLVNLTLSLSMAGIWLAIFTGASLFALYPESTFQHTGNINWLAWYIPAGLLAVLLLVKVFRRSANQDNGKTCRSVFHY